MKLQWGSDGVDPLFPDGIKSQVRGDWGIGLTDPKPKAEMGE